jgi:hypothetical protein
VKLILEVLMRPSRLLALVTVTLGATLLHAGVAHADDALPPVAADAKPAVDSKPGGSAKPLDKKADDNEVSTAQEDHPRFRGGISGGGGLLFITSPIFSTATVMGTGGIDGRLGVQINNLIGVYAQPNFGIFGASLNGSSGGVTVKGSFVGGFVGATALVDFTFIDRIFVGVGGGGVLFQDVGAGEAVLRVGGYPVMGHGDDGVRRKGLMLSLDMRLFVAPAGQYTLIAPSPTINIGYEAY